MSRIRQVKPVKRNGIEKCPTGIFGLDQITQGGLPKGRPTLICGTAGCGKTILAMEFLVRGATQFDEPGVFMAFEETGGELSKNVASMGFDLPALVARRKLILDHVRVERSEIAETGEYDLELSRFGRQSSHRRQVDLKKMVGEAIDDLAPDLKDRKIGWKISDLPLANCDPAQMKIVLANLLSNAVKFTRLRSTATIETGQKMVDGVPTLFVRDNGVGFDMRYAGKLFGVFQRLHRPEEFEGTGVGLATVQRILQKHGGKIWAQAELDKGATFYFTCGVSEAGREQLVAAGVTV